MKLMPCKPLLVENEALHLEPSLISADMRMVLYTNLRFATTRYLDQSDVFLAL
jgi:hypothetical protein